MIGSKSVMLTGIALLALHAQSARAQSASADPAQDGIGDIVVTAQKREARVQDVPVAITAIGGEQLTSQGVTDTISLTKKIPGLNAVITSGYSGKVNYTLRGVGLDNYQETQEAAVAVYQDEIYIAPPVGAVSSLFDIDRVEVLRGPQGTLFGRSASGGLVHFISKTPGSSFGGNIAVGLGSYGERSIDGALDVPLSDTASIRASGRYYGSDGFLRNSTGPTQEGGNLYAGRLQLKLKPTTNLSILLKAEYSLFDSNNAVGYAALPAYVDSFGAVRLVGPTQNIYGVPGGNLLGYRDTDGDFFKIAQDQTGRNRVERQLYSARIEYDLGFATLTSLTGYLNVTKNYFEDLDGSPDRFIDNFVTNRSREFQQEVRLGNANGKIKWTAGAFYFDYRTFFNLDVRFPNGIAIFGLPAFSFDNPANQSKRSIAGFGQIELPLADKLSLTLGVRVEHEKVDFDFRQNYSDVGLVSAVLGTPPQDFRYATVGNFARIDKTYGSRDAVLTYKPSNDALFYLSFKRGIKPGGFSTPTSALPPAAMSFRAEMLDALEGGFKTELFDRNVRLNVSAYHYWYNDYQAVEFTGIGTYTTNADARVDGIDFEAQWRASNHLEFGINGGWLRAIARNIAVNGSAGVTVRDRDLPNAPKLSLNAYAQVKAPVWDGEISFRADVSHRSKTYFTLNNDDALSQDKTTVVDLSAGFARGPWRLQASLNNVFNEKYYVFIQDLASFGLLNGSPGKPRWASVQLSYRW